MPVELVLQAPDLLPCLLELPLGVGTLLAVPWGQARNRPGVTGPASLDDVARVQALPAQQRTLGARIGQRLVLLQNGELVLGAEPPPGGLAAGSPLGTPPSWACAVSDAVVMVMVLRGPVSPWWDCGLLQVSHISLTDRGTGAVASRALLTAASRHGSRVEIAQAIGRELRQSGPGRSAGGVAPDPSAWAQGQTRPPQPPGDPGAALFAMRGLEGDFRGRQDVRRWSEAVAEALDLEGPATPAKRVDRVGTAAVPAGANARSFDR